MLNGEGGKERGKRNRPTTVQAEGTFIAGERPQGHLLSKRGKRERRKGEIPQLEYRQEGSAN